MIPQYRIFYSWQSDNIQAKEILQQALDGVVRQLRGEGIAIQIEQGGGGCGFISIEDSVRIKIRRCDIFVGDVTPVGNVAMKGKLLPNANVMYEMGVATECMQADRILAVAMKGEWKVEDMPFDFNHYTMLRYDPEKDFNLLVGSIKKRINDTNTFSRRSNRHFFSERIVSKNIASGKFLPDTFLEDFEAKEKARVFVAPHKMYPMFYDQVTKLNFDYYNKVQLLEGKKGGFRLNVKKWDIQNKTVDIERLRVISSEIQTYLTKREEVLRRNGNEGRFSSRKIEQLASMFELMNKQVMVVTSDAGQGKTNFVCDIVRNVFIPEGVPYVFTNAYELSAEQLAKSIAAEYNFIGDYSLEEVLTKAEQFCHQRLQYLVVVIDGLNEHPQQGLFKTNLARVLNSLKDHLHVKVLLTCRKEFYDRNYRVIRQVVDDDLFEVQLDKRYRRWDRSESSDDKCLIERYATHFSVKEPISSSIRSVLLDDMLLMRIFFQGYQGQDVSQKTQIDYVDLYGKYYALLCEQIQTLIEHEAHVSDIRGMAARVFNKVIELMINKNVFTNLQLKDVLEALTSDERQCFTAFMSSNLLLRQDMQDSEYGVSDVLNFTHEQIRDYLVTRYLVDVIYQIDSKRFLELVDQYTSESNNQSEGTKMFLFLYTRNLNKSIVYELIKKQPWHDKTLIDYVWDIQDENITNNDIAIIKEHIAAIPDETALALAYTHWSPVKYSKLNIQLLLEVLEGMSKDDRIAYLDALWPRKLQGKTYFGEPPMVTERGEYLRALKDGIERRKEKDDIERIVLEKMEEYLKEDADFVYIPQHKNKRVDSPFVIYSFKSYKYLMRVHKGNKEEFLAVAGVKYGYALEMFSSIYDAIFSESKDVMDIYLSYYSNEYSCFESFLSMHYSIPSDIVKEFSRVAKEPDYRLIEFDALSYGGGAVSNFVLSDELIERMYNWLNWQDNEDKN